MSVVDRNVALNLEIAYQRRNPNEFPVQRNYYADDTVLISINPAAAIRLLAKVEGNSEQFGLRFNRNNFRYIFLNGNDVVKFPDGRKLNRVEKTDLGHQITQEMGVKRGMQHKMHQTLKAWFKLDMVQIGVPSGRQQFVPPDGNCKFLMPLSETNFSME